MNKVKIIGAGLAGIEAAYYLLKKGVELELYEMRPKKKTKAHTTSNFGELVCSNSLKSERLDNACGLLKEELKILDSLSMKVASECKIPSGTALTVDREKFSSLITKKIKSFKNLTFKNEEVKSLDDSLTILATGPLTSDDLSSHLVSIIDDDNLFFFDASSPIVTKDSIDFNHAYYKSRYDEGEASYINCPLTKEEYYNFVHELVNAKKALVHNFDKAYFFACQPIEVMASKGKDTLRYGPLKPKGLEINEQKPYAVVQLRQDNLASDLYNLVGFQTNLTYKEQKRVFSLIPALRNAEFVRYGLMHRNSYMNAPKVLDKFGRIKNKPNVLVGGQLSGVEGYVESMMSGLIMGINAYRILKGKEPILPSLKTMSGTLLHYIYNASPSHFEPMNSNYGIYFNPNSLSKDEIASLAIKEIKQYLEIIENE